MKYIITTLGCKVNQYETQAIETMLAQRGHGPAADGETADAVIVNTCAVTAESGRKSRQTVRHLMSRNPGAASIVCGCWSQLSPDDALEIGCDVVYGTGEKHKLIDAIEAAVAEKQAAREIDDPFRRMTFEQLPAGAVSGRTRAMLKVEDGCVNFCSYCIIPYTRGRIRSLPLDKVRQQAKELQDEGYRELVITGIEIAAYGKDLPGEVGLADCIEAIAEAAPLVRMRLGSLEPTVITEDFARRLAATGRVCDHFHLSLQSGCDKILKNMNRKYTTQRFYESVQYLRKYFPGCAFTTDVITGFPGETMEDQAETLAFIQKCGFADMHIFPYSVRPGTKAEKMPGQVVKAEKSRRAHEAVQVAEQMHKAYLESCIGMELEVLFETEQPDGSWNGHAGNYCVVNAKGDDLKNNLCKVTIQSHSDDILYGVLL